jgi:hypothetical protein
MRARAAADMVPSMDTWLFTSGRAFSQLSGFAANFSCDPDVRVSAGSREDD